MKVALKYCGSCNPQVELGPIARRLRDLVGEAVSFVPPGDGAGLVIILNGCRTACADRPDVRDHASAALVVAGESLELEPVPETHLAERLAELILARM